MAQVVEIVPYDPAWPSLFAALGVRLRDALASVALRIDHIGSTSVPGLAAKPIVDIQVSVAALDPVDAYRVPLEGLGLVFRPENTEWTKRYFREAPGMRRTHIHVRRAGSFSKQCKSNFGEDAGTLGAHGDCSFATHEIANVPCCRLTR